MSAWSAFNKCFNFEVIISSPYIHVYCSPFLNIGLMNNDSNDKGIVDYEVSGEVGFFLCVCVLFSILHDSTGLMK